MYGTPRKKQDVLNRMMSVDFSGLHNLDPTGRTIVERPSRHMIKVTFLTTGETYEISVHKRRDENRTAQNTATGRQQSTVRVNAQKVAGKAQDRTGTPTAKPATGRKRGRPPKNKQPGNEKQSASA